MAAHERDITAQLERMRRELGLINASAANAMSALETQTELLRTIVGAVAAPRVDDDLTDALLRLATYLERQTGRPGGAGVEAPSAFDADDGRSA